MNLKEIKEVLEESKRIPPKRIRVRITDIGPKGMGPPEFSRRRHNRRPQERE